MSDLDEMIDAVLQVSRIKDTIWTLQSNRARAAERLQELDNEIAEFQNRLKALARAAYAAWKKNPLKDVIEDEAP